MPVGNYPIGIEEKQDAIAYDRSLKRRSLAYVCAGLATTGAILGLVGAAFILTAAVATISPSQRDQQDRTWLAQKIDDARGVRQSLAKQLPAPPPLPTIHVRVTHRNGFSGTKANLRSNTTARNWAQARSAFATLEPLRLEVPLNAFQQFDRHAIH